MYELKMVLSVEPVILTFLLTFSGIYGLSSIFLRTREQAYGQRRLNRSLEELHHREIAHFGPWHF
jgi:hypothetical protein